MADFSNGTAAQVGRVSDAAMSGVGEVAETIGDATGRARGKLNSARQPMADKLHRAADRVRNRADRLPGGHTISGAAKSAADRLDASASYIESTDARGMMQDLLGVIKRHPAKSLLVAGAAAFLIGRAFRSKD